MRKDCLIITNELSLDPVGSFTAQTRKFVNSWQTDIFYK